MKAKLQKFDRIYHDKFNERKYLLEWNLIIEVFFFFFGENVSRDDNLAGQVRWQFPVLSFPIVLRVDFYRVGILTCQVNSCLGFG